MARRRRTPWQRIYLATLAGTGCRLSADDVLALGADDAIMTVGRNDHEDWLEKREPGSTLFEEPLKAGGNPSLTTEQQGG